MKFTLKNIGLTKSAEIELPGLTVIAGHNDVGKSTVGKAVFTVVKTIAEEEAYRDSKNKKIISSELADLYQRVRTFTKQKPHVWESFHAEFTMLTLGRAIEKKLFYKNEISEFVSIKLSTIQLNIENCLNDDLKKGNISENDRKEILEFIQADLANLKEKLLGGLLISDSYKEVFNFFIKTIFEEEINNKYVKESASISVTEGKINLCEAHFEDNKTTEVKVAEPLGIDDVTYIDTPLIYDIAKYVNSMAISGEGKGEEDIIKTKIDLIRKLSRINKEVSEKELEKIFDQISETIEGKFSYDSLNNQFFYTSKKTQHEFKASNIASGIKSFGILQLLIQNGYIHKNALLIVDEPEVHLHPEWQIVYARVLCLLAKAGVPILISSHSPYMIEAIKRIGDKEIPDRLKFYLGERTDEGAIYQDVSENLDPVFEKLSHPMKELIFRT
jgi:predicted ATPase